MNKILSAFIASIIAAIPVQAADTGVSDSNSVNNITLTKEITAEDITVNNTTIPAGSTAFTVNITENQGVCLFGLNINMGSGYEIITGEDDRPLFTKCKYVNYISEITGAVSGENVVLNGLFADDCTVNGGIITFYAQENPDSQDKNFSVDSSELYGSTWRDYGSGIAYVSAGCPLKSYNEETPAQNPVYDSVYMIGDFNGDMSVDLTDAFISHHIVYTGAVLPSDFLYFYEFQDYCLPNIANIRAAFIWNTYTDADSEMQSFSYDTARTILEYCADKSAGKTIVDGSYIGMICHS